MRRHRAFDLVLVTLLGMGVVFKLSPAADHLDAPALTPPGGDPRLDINDVYVFRGADTSNTVMIMTVNPLAGVLGAETFHPDASYDFLIDNDGDAKEDLVFKTKFSSPDTSGRQDVSMRGVPASRIGLGGAVLAVGQTGDVIPVAGGGKLKAHVFDDPFFFDLIAFLGGGGRTFCDGSERNFFRGLNVTAIVLEIPGTRLGSNKIGLWARTELNDVQVDRMGRPAINTVFIPSSFKNAFNAGLPRHDLRDFSAFFGPFSALLLPDILTVDTASGAGFLNGRRLQDDVIDIELSLIKGLTRGDCVGNDSSFSGSFPYLAPRN